MKRLISIALCSVVLSGIATMARADPFDWAPEYYAPRWETPFPYQRNITWDFDDPSNVFAPRYEGTLDGALHSSDFVNWQGQGFYWQWAQGKGAIGAYNDGTNGTSVDFNFHIDNTTQRLQYKHIWLEMDYLLVGAGGGTIYAVAGPGSNVTDVWSSGARDRGDGWSRLNVWWELQPNPDWEEVHFALNAPNVGDGAWLDKVHIATECVPEPSSLGFALMGLGLLAIARRRRSR